MIRRPDTELSTSALAGILAGRGWPVMPDGHIGSPGLSDAALVGALRSLAADGVFPTQAAVRRHRAGEPFEGDPGGWFEQRRYRVRPAEESDLPALLELEARCWAEPLQADAATLSTRIGRSAASNHVVEVDGRVVGVMYTQPIAEVAPIFQSDFRRVEGLYRPDGAIVQALAINILPEMRPLGLGDQLLEFVLQLATLDPRVASVVGVTRCARVDGGEGPPLEAYVALRDSHGLPVDPILGFHASHGARIGRLIAGYRPPDVENGGSGVFVEYDLKQRLLPREAVSVTSGPGRGEAVAQAVDDVIESLIPDGAEGAFSRDRALRELGFDSFRLASLRMVLGQRLGVAIEPTLFFRHGTPRAIAAFLAGGAAPADRPARRRAIEAPDLPPEPADDGTGPARAGATAIAIVGLACRLPGGVHDPAGFWSLLRDGVDAVSRPPPGRADAADRAGGYLEGIEDFDAPFFRIAPVEAAAMDPQQRLLLETHWEALEHAGIDPTGLAGTDTGVFVGVFAEDYKQLQRRGDQPLSPYFGTGTANSIAAGRVAYFLGTAGPAMVIDTACSSSLVAVHQACQSLRCGESDRALASGVNLILDHGLSAAFDRAGMLAPDGRCKTFDAAADGYVRSEGCGVVVLERLADARARGARVLAVIRGTAINQDGASNGLTAPNGLAQAAVIRKALAAAGVPPATVGYVEAHGTGTPLGDPIEVEALAAVYGPGRAVDAPLVVGSVKTNIGHAESAAGIAGLIKAVLALQHGYIPPHLHFRRLNPHLARFPIAVLAEGQPWPPTKTPRRAGVSAFGFSGTNAHVIVEAAPPTSTAAGGRTHHLLTTSARSPAALRMMARRMAARLAEVEPDTLSAVAATCHRGRAHFEHRLALVASSADEARRGFEAWAAGSPAEVGHRGRAMPGGPKVAFLFTGQGAQYREMGRALYETEPVFADRLDRCDAVFRAVAGRSLLELIYPEVTPAHDDIMTSHPCGQAVTFAVECALADLWRGWGIEPDVVLGHSLGDFAAAYTAGVLSLEDGLRLVTIRGRLMETARGRMVAVRAADAEVERRIAGLGEVTIGVINGPRSVVISGSRAGVAAAVQRLQADGIETRPLDIPVAAHSSMLDPVLDDFEAAVAQVALAAPTVPVISSMTGARVSDALTTPGYWRSHLRQPVRFADGVAALGDAGCRVLIEVGPQRTLLGLAEQVLDGAAEGAVDDRVMLPSLHPTRDGRAQMLDSLGALYALGCPIDWRTVDHGASPHTMGHALPTYAFERARHWIARPDADDLGDWLGGQDLGQLGARLEASGRVNSVQVEALGPLVRAMQAERRAEGEAARIDGLFSSVVWRPRDGDRAGSGPLPGRWLIVRDAGGVGRALAGRLRLGGATVEAVGRGRLGDVPALLRSAPGWRGVLFLAGLDGAATPDAGGGALSADQAMGCGALLDIVQAGLRDAPKATPIWIVTRGAQPVAGRAVTAPDQAALWGMGRGLSLEHPEWWGGAIDLDPAADVEAAAAAVERSLATAVDEDQLGWRGDRCYVARLAPAPPMPATARAAVRAGGLYLITGGLGNVGLHAAGWLAERGARHLVLTGRRGVRTPAQAQAVEALVAAGVDVRVAAVDVADAQAMDGLFADITAAPAPLRGVIHAAGVSSFRPLAETRWADFVDMLRPKLLGACHLHRLTGGAALDFFVCHASGAGIWGGREQAHYGAANHALDGLMAWRRGQGLPGTSIAWGLWRGPGLVGADARARLEGTGLRPLSAADASAALDRIVGADVAGVVVADVDWARLVALYAMGRPRRFLREMAPEPQAEPAPATDEALIRALKALPAASRFARLADHVQRALADILGMGTPPDGRTGFRDLGLDSIMALDLRRGLERAIGQRLPATVAFEYPTVEGLTRHLLDDVLALAEPRPAPEVRPAASPAGPPTGDAIAVVSVACRFPGADTPEAFWDDLRRGADRVRETPTDRWDVAAVYDPRRPVPGRTYVRQAAYVDRVDGFDPEAFGIAPREAAGMDPQHWMLLEVGSEAVERAGLAGATLSGSRTGVFVGIGTESFGGLAATDDPAALDAYAITGGGHNAAPGRLAYLLGLQGPVMVVDTACSSSLVAVHLACQSLRAGECDMALAGGVSLMLSPKTSIALSQMQVLAPDGRCKTFDAAADGYGRGEGCGVIVLKRLAEARADGDRILAVIEGSAVNHDGPSSGLTVPNRRAQERLIRDALTAAGRAPDAVDYVETHGTGTPLGDPIELRALARVFGGRSRPLVIGTAKTNIGHLEAAAGIAGVIKTVLAIHHGEIPRHVHFREAHPDLEGVGALFEIPITHRDWPGQPGGPRVAGVSAFGISGTNAHVVLSAIGGLPAEPARPADRAHHLLPLSARGEAALDALAGRYAAALNEADVDLGDLCHTAAIGRRHHGHRLAVRATDRAAMADALAAVARGEAHPAVERGSIGRAAPRVGFVFTGQGAQSAGMGRALYATCPPFRATIDRCAATLKRHGIDDLVGLLHAPAATPDPLEDTARAQPALLAIEVALAALWRSWGIEPVVLIGHSLGEIAAAVVAGVFDLDDGLALVAARGRLMGALPRGGRMVALELPDGLDEAWLRAQCHGSDGIDVAAVNGPRSLVLSGERRAVEAVVERCVAAGAAARPLRVSHAFHSPAIDPMLDDFRAVAQAIDYRPPRIPLIANLTGRLADDAVATPDYWVRHARQAVRFADGVEAALALGVDALVEIGPHPAALGLVGGVIGARGGPQLLPSLRRGRDDWQQLLGSLGALYVRGAQIDWPAVDAGLPRRRVTQPTYAFQRTLRWRGSRPAAPAACAMDLRSLLDGLDADDALGPAARAALPEIAAAMAAVQNRRAIDDAVTDWLYRIEWQPMPSAEAADHPSDGTWLIFADAAGTGDALAEALRRPGRNVTRVFAYGPAPDDAVVIDPRAPADYDRLLEARPAQIVHLWSLDAPPIDAPQATISAAVERACGSVAQLARAVAARPGYTPRLRLVTAGACAVTADDRVDGVTMAPMWGLGAVLGLEHPALRCARVDLEAPGPGQASALAAELLGAADREDAIALRGGRRHVARLTRYRAPTAAPTIRGAASYLVVGGLGGLGLRVARWLVERGARHLILASRSAPRPAAARAVAALRARGVTVSVAALDVGDRAQLDRLLAGIDPTHPLAGVVHAATARAPGALLARQSWPRFEAMLRAKMLGTIHLHRATAGMALDIFVCFSSLTTVFGDLGLGPYVTANAFLDGLAHHRRARGLPGLTIDWGIWSGVGAALDLTGGALDDMTRQGHGRIAPDHGVAALGRALGGGAPRLLVAPVDWAAFARDRRPALFDELLPAPADVTHAPSPGSTTAAPDGVAAQVARRVGELLGLPPDGIDPARDLLTLGFDSLMGVELRNHIRSTWGVDIPLTVFMRPVDTAALAGSILRAAEPIPAAPEEDWETGEL